MRFCLLLWSSFHFPRKMSLTSVKLLKVVLVAIVIFEDASVEISENWGNANNSDIDLVVVVVAIVSSEY